MKVAVSDRCGETTFLVDRASGATGSLVSPRENKHSLHQAYGMAEAITCATAAVDSLIANGLPASEFIKIDVEGTEHLVLAGAGSCLAQNKPVLIVETSSTDLTCHLCEMGYRAFHIDGENALLISAAAGVDFEQVANTFPEFSSKTS